MSVSDITVIAITIILCLIVVFIGWRLLEKQHEKYRRLLQEHTKRMTNGYDVACPESNCKDCDNYLCIWNDKPATTEYWFNLFKSEEK